MLHANRTSYGSRPQYPASNVMNIMSLEKPPLGLETAVTLLPNRRTGAAVAGYLTCGSET